MEKFRENVNLLNQNNKVRREDRIREFGEWKHFLEGAIPLVLREMPEIKNCYMDGKKYFIGNIPMGIKEAVVIKGRDLLEMSYNYRQNVRELHRIVAYEGKILMVGNIKTVSGLRLFISRRISLDSNGCHIYFKESSALYSLKNFYTIEEFVDIVTGEVERALKRKISL